MAPCARFVNKSSPTAVRIDPLSPAARRLFPVIFRHRRRLLSLFAGLGCAFALAQPAARVTTPGVVRGYTVAFFNDEGFPHVRVEGATADVRDPQRVALGDMKLTVYTGTADRGIDAVLTSPTALLEPEPKRVTGPESVRLERSDLTLEGEDWTYEYLGPDDHRVQVRRNARIVFNAALADLLK